MAPATVLVAVQSSDGEGTGKMGDIRVGEGIADMLNAGIDPTTGKDRHDIELKRMKAQGREVALHELPTDLRIYRLEELVKELLQRVE